jgi:hypothetical protein
MRRKLALLLTVASFSAPVLAAQTNIPIITPNNGSFTDAKGNVYTINADDNNTVDINGQPVSLGGRASETSALALVNGQIWGQDENSHQWFLLGDQGAWQPYSAPPSAIANDPRIASSLVLTDPTNGLSQPFAVARVDNQQAAALSSGWTSINDNGQTYQAAVLTPADINALTSVASSSSPGTPSQSSKSMPAYQSNQSSPSVQPGPATPVATPPPATAQQINTESECGTSAASQYVTARNGQIYGPNGQPVVFNGVNVDEQELPQAVGALVQSLPGTNIIRLAIFDPNKDTADYLMPYVLQLNSEGITVEIEDHNYPDVLTGSSLQQVAQWYRSLAQAFIGDPYVIFGTQNEPSGNLSDVQTMMDTIYGAIRSTGNNTLILITAAGGSSLAGFSESTFANMSNVAFGRSKACCENLELCIVRLRQQGGQRSEGTSGRLAT